MTKDELKQKCKERAKIFQQAIESCHSSSPMDCIEWFADRIADLEKENAELKERLKNLNLNTNIAVRDLNNLFTKAREIIALGLRVCETSSIEYMNLYQKRAEQFLKGENIILEDAQVGNSPFDADKVFNKEMKAYPEEKVK